MHAFVRLAPLALVAALAAPASAQAEDPGPFAVGWRDVAFVDPVVGNVAARVYYPATIAGEGTPVDPGGGPYPPSGFLHGWLGTPADYDDLCTHVASWGFVVGSIGTETGFFGTMQAEAADTAALLRWLEDENVAPASPLFGAIDVGAEWSAFGHSMGGGALFYLIDEEPRVNVLVPLQAYLGTFLGGSAQGEANLQSFTGRMLSVAGSIDAVNPPATHAIPYHEMAQACARRAYVEVIGMGHTGPLDLPDLGEPLSAAEQSRLHRRLTTGFLRAEVLGEEDLFVELVGEGVLAEPIERESVMPQPALWMVESSATAGALTLGVAGVGADAFLLGVSLGTTSIPTAFGVLGIDLTTGVIVGEGAIGADGIVEVVLTPPPSLSGVPLHGQAITVGATPGTLTRTGSVVVP